MPIIYIAIKADESMQQDYAKKLISAIGKCASCKWMDLSDYEWTSGFLCTYNDSRAREDWDGKNRCLHYEYGRDSENAQYMIDHK